MDVFLVLTFVTVLFVAPALIVRDGLMAVATAIRAIDDDEGLS